jgi:hypothetical protein
MGAPSGRAARIDWSADSEWSPPLRRRFTPTIGHRRGCSSRGGSGCRACGDTSRAAAPVWTPAPSSIRARAGSTAARTGRTRNSASGSGWSRSRSGPVWRPCRGSVDSFQVRVRWKLTWCSTQDLAQSLTTELDPPVVVMGEVGDQLAHACRVPKPGLLPLSCGFRLRIRTH